MADEDDNDELMEFPKSPAAQMSSAMEVSLSLSTVWCLVSHCEVYVCILPVSHLCSKHPNIEQ